jgi:hypothetical protein
VLPFAGLDTSNVNELQDLVLANDTLKLTKSASKVYFPTGSNGGGFTGNSGKNIITPNYCFSSKNKIPLDSLIEIPDLLPSQIRPSYADDSLFVVYRFSATPTDIKITFYRYYFTGLSFIDSTALIVPCSPNGFFNFFAFYRDNSYFICSPNDLLNFDLNGVKLFGPNQLTFNNFFSPYYYFDSTHVYLFNIGSTTWTMKTYEISNLANNSLISIGKNSAENFGYPKVFNDVVIFRPTINPGPIKQYNLTTNTYSNLGGGGSSRNFDYINSNLFSIGYNNGSSPGYVLNSAFLTNGTFQLGIEELKISSPGTSASLDLNNVVVSSTGLRIFVGSNGPIRINSLLLNLPESPFNFAIEIKTDFNFNNAEVIDVNFYGSSDYEVSFFLNRYGVETIKRHVVYSCRDNIRIYDPEVYFSFY